MKRVDSATARPVLKWVGGKTKLLPKLLRLAPKEFLDYHEPFVGGGALFFALYSAGRLKKKSWLNDANKELMDVYVTVRDNVGGLIECLKVLPNTAEAFERIRNEPQPVPGVPLSVAEAARTIYLNKTCFNGLYRVNRKGKFNSPFGRYKNPTICDEGNLSRAKLALSGVSLLSVNFEEATFSVAKGDFVYFDPPYLQHEDEKNFVGFTAEPFLEDDHERLAALAHLLVERGASVMVSNADTPFARRLYKGPRFRIHSVKAPRSINSKGDARGPVSEIIAVSKKQ